MQRPGRCFLAIAGLLSLAALAPEVLTFAAKPARAGQAQDQLTVALARETDFIDRLRVNSRETQLFSALVYDTLIYLDPQTMKMSGSLAESWRFVDDRTIEFKLRKGVRFHNGDAFTADDVVFTIGFVTNPASKLAQQQADFGNFAGAERVDDNTVLIRLKAPDPIAEQTLATRLLIWPKAYTERSGADAHNKAPVGTGPYRLSAMKAGSSYTLVRNDEYFAGARPKPAIRTLEFRVIPDIQTQVAEFISGGIDFSLDIDADTARQIESVPNLRVAYGGSTRLTYLNLDSSGRSGETPLKKAEVRHAIAQAIDRKTIAERLVGHGAVSPAGQCNPNQMLCIQDGVDTPAFDPQKARALLAGAGYPAGFTIDMSSSADVKPIGEAVQGYLAAVGIKVNYQTFTLPAWRTQFIQGKSTMSVMGWGGGGGIDADYAIGTFYNGSDTDYARDAEVTKLAAQGRSTLDRDVRAGLYKQIFGLINQRAYSVPLYGNIAVYVTGANVVFPTPRIDSPDLSLLRWR